MLKSFTEFFDYTEFKKKLKRYFSDTAPIYAGIELRLNEIRVSFNNKVVVYYLDSKITVKENIYLIIKQCEQELYPKMVSIAEQQSTLANDKIKEMLLQGYTLEQIHGKQIKKTWKLFVVTRFNTQKNSIDYREEFTGKLFRAHFNRPLVTSRNTILRLADGGIENRRELYKLIVENSRVEELEDKLCPDTDEF